MRRPLSASLLTALLTLCVAVSVGAGDDKKKSHPDFSGTWLIDRKKSDYGLFSGARLAQADATLVIEHKDPELKITRTLKLGSDEETRRFAYYTDERGETNPAGIGGGEVKTKTKWEGDLVVARANFKRPGPDGQSVDVELTQRWSLSSDGGTLTNTNVMSGGLGVAEMKLVYHRAP